MRDMTLADRLRLRADHGSHKLFKRLIQGSEGGGVLKVSDLRPGEYLNLRTLLELGYVEVIDGVGGDLIVQFTITSLKRLGYL